MQYTVSKIFRGGLLLKIKQRILMFINNLNIIPNAMLVIECM